MNKVGALGRGNSTAVIYFCTDCSREEAIKVGVTQLIGKSAYREDDILDNIELLAIESSDSIQKDIKTVGLVFQDASGTFKSILLSAYEDLKSDLADLVGW